MFPRRLVYLIGEIFGKRKEDKNEIQNFLIISPVFVSLDFTLFPGLFLRLSPAH